MLTAALDLWIGAEDWLDDSDAVSSALLSLLETHSIEVSGTGTGGGTLKPFEKSPLLVSMRFSYLSSQLPTSKVVPSSSRTSKTTFRSEGEVNFNRDVNWMGVTC